MIKVTNLLSRPRSFSLNTGKTLRLNALESKEINNDEVTKEMEKNVLQGFLDVRDVPKPKKKKKKEES